MFALANGDNDKRTNNNTFIGRELFGEQLKRLFPSAKAGQIPSIGRLSLVQIEVFFGISPRQDRHTQPCL